MKIPPDARVGSQRWLQIAVNRATGLVDQALKLSGAIEDDDAVTWNLNRPGIRGGCLV